MLKIGDIVIIDKPRAEVGICWYKQTGIVTTKDIALITSYTVDVFGLGESFFYEDELKKVGYEPPIREIAEEFFNNIQEY
jgi:hypothetical protein